MKHVVSHGLGFETARKVADHAMDAYKARFPQYKPNARWLDEKRAEITFSVKGMSLNGSIEVNDKDIELELEVPFLLKPFKGKALAVIEEEIKEWVAKAKSGEVI